MDMRFLMKQAQQMQTKLQEAQKALRAEGTAGGAMVKVTLNGAKELMAHLRRQGGHGPRGPQHAGGPDHGRLQGRLGQGRRGHGQGHRRASAGA